MRTGNDRIKNSQLFENLGYYFFAIPSGETGLELI
jgi:hypothetical protein